MYGIRVFHTQPLTTIKYTFYRNILIYDGFYMFGNRRFNVRKTVIYIYIYIYGYIIVCFTCISIIYRVSQEECARLREGIPYVKV